MVLGEELNEVYRIEEFLECDDEFPVRCFKCCGDGYIPKDM